MSIIVVMDREVAMMVGVEVDAAIDVLKRFAQQTRDQIELCGRQTADVVARLDIELSNIEAMLAAIRTIRTDLGQQAARRFISPWF